MKFLRRLVFYLFIALYLTVCPLIILYAFGYIYNPQRKDVEEIGLIHIKTLPKKATVYLESSKYRFRTPTTIYNLFPGKYRLGVFLKGYRPWIDYIKVTAGKAVDLEKILLLPYEFSVEEIIQKPISDILPVEDAGSLLIFEKLKTKRHERIKVFNIDNVQLNDLIDNINIDHVYLVEDSSDVLVKTKQKGKTEYQIVDIAEDEKAKNITKLIESEPLYILWSDMLSDYIFTFQKDYIDMIDTTKGGVYPEYLKAVKGFGLSGTSIYVLNDNNTIQKMEYNEPEGKEYLEKNNVQRKIFSQSNSTYFRIDVLEDEIIAFLGNKQDLIINLRPFLIPDEKIIGTKYFEDDNKLLVWTKQKIGMITFQIEEKTKTETEQGDGSANEEEYFEYDWIYEGGKDIRQCYFVYSGSHVILADRNSVILLSPDSEGAYNKYDIVQIQPDTHIYYSESDGRVYFISTKDRHLSAINILPQS